MSTAKVAITLERETLAKLDHLIRKRAFKNRSRAIQAAVQEKLERMEQSRLARECAKLDPKFEQAMAEEGFGVELDQWPEY